MVAQAAPVLHSHVRAQLRLWQRLGQCEQALRERCADWAKEGREPVCLRDADPPRVQLALEAGRTHCLVWAATGYDEIACGQPKPLTVGSLAAMIKALPTIRRPCSAVICLQYGARRAAARLRAAGVRCVVWLQAKGVSSRQVDFASALLPRLLPEVVAPLLQMLHNESRHMLAHFRDLCGTLPGVGECGLEGHAVSLQWHMASPPPPKIADAWLINESPSGCVRCQTNLLGGAHDFAPPLGELDLLVDDVAHVERLRGLLEVDSGKARGVDLWSAAKVPFDEVLAGRCRAVALESLASFLVAGSVELIWRVSDDASLEQAQAKASALAADARVLLWVDLGPEPLEMAALQSALETRLRCAGSAVVFTCTPERLSEKQALCKALKLRCTLVRLPATEPDAARASHHHDELRFRISADAKADAASSLAPTALRGAIEEALGGGHPLCALYTDDDGSVVARLGITDVGFLHALRDRVLMGSLAVELTGRLRRLAADATLSVDLDLTAFAERYESSVLHLDKLTPHQLEKWKECQLQASVRVEAPAGGGKTFLALHEMLAVLEADDESAVLFAAPHVALAHFVAGWICARIDDVYARDETLGRLWALLPPFGEGVRRCAVSDDDVVAFDASDEPPPAFALVVADEAHHIYGQQELRELVEGHVGPSTRRLLLADVSQSRGDSIAYPEGKRVVLTEVVRCSARIVAAASSFQLGGDERLATRPHTTSTGPPLRTYLFDAPGPDAYADSVATALKELVAMFPGLSLHNRLAILVPEEPFRAALEERLHARLAGAVAGRRFRLVSAAAAAAAVVPSGAEHGGEVGSGGGGASGGERSEAIIVDLVEHFDGLERLMILAVGLDAPIGESGDAGSADTLEVRSQPPRATPRSSSPMRAHRMHASTEARGLADGCRVCALGAGALAAVPRDDARAHARGRGQPRRPWWLARVAHARAAAGGRGLRPCQGDGAAARRGDAGGRAWRARAHPRRARGRVARAAGERRRGARGAHCERRARGHRSRGGGRAADGHQGGDRTGGGRQPDRACTGGGEQLACSRL